RMESSFVTRLAADLPRGTIVLVGPQCDCDPALKRTDRVVCLGAVPYEMLPHLAREAAVLIMPYADIPVTRAMQPLNLKEYLVTGPDGGPAKTILNSPRFLSAGGYRMLCAYMHPPGDPGFEHLRQKARIAQAPLYSVYDRGPWDWRVLCQFLRICRRERVEIW